MAAAPILMARQASVRLGPKPLFQDIDLALYKGDRACLVGRNGVGKSTLLKALASQIALDGGEVFRQPGQRVAYLEQEPDLSGFSVIADYVEAGLPADLAGETHRAEAVLEPLGLDPARTTAGLSGGEARRAALARVLVGDPDILLLDEPTNHLDLPAIAWLEERLRDHRGAVLLISHDRSLLRRVTDKLFWMDRGVMRVRDGGYDGFEAWAETIWQAEDEAAAKLDKRIAEEARWAVEGITARRKRNQGRLRRLAEMRVQRRERQPRKGGPTLDIAEAERSGKLVIDAKAIGKAFDGRTIVSDFSTRLIKGDRVGVVGPNGAGKTTLVKMLIGEMPPDSGHVRLGANLQTAWFDQRREQLDPEMPVRRVLVPGGGDFMDVGGRRRHVSGYLADFLFDPGQMMQPVKALSGGERNRLLLAQLFAKPSNLLVLDEPTNDLDLETLDLLEEVLADYAGTLILVSHDRDFLDRLVTSTIAVGGGGRVAEYVGGYEDALRQGAGDLLFPPVEADPKPRRKVQASAPTPAPKAPARPAPAGLSGRERTELDALPQRIAKLEADIAKLSAALAAPGAYERDPATFNRASARLSGLEQDKAALEDRWLLLAEKAEQG